MTWVQLHERMSVMAELIDRAAKDLDEALDFACSLPDVERLFGGEEGLLLSLEQRWVTMLTAKLDQADYDEIPAERAAAELAAHQPGLRALLDAAARRSVRVRSVARGDKRIVDVFGRAGTEGAASLPGLRTSPGAVDMSWSQQHERMALMAKLIDRAAGGPDAALDFACSLPDVERLFGGEEGLLLALEQRWATMLTAKLDQADYDAIPAERAVAALAAHQPGLRALRDAAARRSVRVRSVERGDEWIVDVFGGAGTEGALVSPTRTVA